MTNNHANVQLIGSSCNRLIIGLGKTGLSCARYLHQQGLPFAMMDTRENPPGVSVCREEFADVPLHLGGFNEQWLMAADELVVSPGIALAEPAIARAIEHGATAIGDIELFCRAVEKPVVAITGSNGKSTVTTLVGEMARQAGLKVAVGGNIGTPALDLLADENADVYVLELSSFQLETTYSLRAAAATVLNLSADHMDRYPTLIDYHQAKQRIYRGCATAVFNREDPLTTPLLPVSAGAITFTSGTPDLGQMGLLTNETGVWLSKGMNKLINTRELKLKGRHNFTNALAALALGEALGLTMDAMLTALRAFPGLPHRCQWVGEFQGVSWFNDSKATNVGAAVAAIEGLGNDLPGSGSQASPEKASGKIVLIAGGEGKGAEFSGLQPAVERYVSHLVLIGRDGADIAQAVQGSTTIHWAETLSEAVKQSAALANSGDAVLLAPACASFDMFDSFEQRGEEFVRLVQERLC